VAACLLALCACDPKLDEDVVEQTLGSAGAGANVFPIPTGTLTIEFPEATDATVWVFRGRGGQDFSTVFPAHFIVPLGQQALLLARDRRGRKVESEVTLTNEQPNQRILLEFPKPEAPKPLWLFGFRVPDLPKSTGFVPAKGRKVAPVRVLFQVSRGPAGGLGLGFVIDSAGRVMLGRERERGSDYKLLGHVPAAKVARMVANTRKGVLLGRASLGGGCNDCGHASISVWDASENKFAEIANDGEFRRRVPTAEAEEAMLWLLAVMGQSGLEWWK
jgi:hypothetical protein